MSKSKRGIVVTMADLRAITGTKPKQITPKILDAINHFSGVYGANESIRRMSMFLANSAVETWHFRTLEENLNYSSAGLQKTFGYYRNRPGEARADARKPQTIANKVYADKNRSARFKLGNIRDGDGWMYRGSGTMQTTGRHNFKEIEKVTGLPVTKHPEMLRQPMPGTEAAMIYWSKRNLFELADQNRITEVRVQINGGTHGLDQVKKFYANAIARFRKRYTDDGWLKGEAPPITPTTPAPQPPTPSDPSTANPRMLRRGMTGDDVKQIQEKLNSLGYETLADGVFGENTERSVIRFQRVNKLPVDGKIGPLTRASLNGSPIAAPMEPKPPVPEPVLRKGNLGGRVAFYQGRLNVHGFGLKVDGDFGNATESAVNKFQFKNSLKVDGVIGPQTMAALNRKPKIPQFMSSQSGFTQDNETLRPMSPPKAVERMQGMAPKEDFPPKPGGSAIMAVTGLGAFVVAGIAYISDFWSGIWNWFGELF